ncbi:MAG TPA: FAD-dependent monooxygenase [Pyrinomonadaceae bacterium]|nr:FAD-dependent monooxygenase [Pyrinomonadaceae bacterium]
MAETVKHYDVAIIGAGLAGLALARQLLLYTGKTVLLVERRAEVPPARQKVGEATVQMSAYYFSKVLDLEEHLLREHFMKYNLRFFWKAGGRAGDRYEDYSQSYIRSMSNIATYQLDRNKLEAEMLRLNLLHENFEFRAPAAELEVSLSGEGAHRLRFRQAGREVSATVRWVVDTSGRCKFLARRLGLERENVIRHGAAFFWVEGLVNVEKLTDAAPRDVRLNPARREMGHLPVWLATNHFCGEGFWFWVIPLQGKTSLGLVYDNRTFPRERVETTEKLVEWVCREFPLFARDLARRKILARGSLRDFSYDCERTISPARWALAGEAGRFTDPLYSPGGDLIALYNTLITDAVLTEGDAELSAKAALYERLMKALYEAYVPSYGTSYDVLGDQEAMTLKYTWELAVYFSFYVFPFINDLFTDRLFAVSYLNRFSRLGPVNRGLQKFLRDFYHWKKRHRPRPAAPVFNDFTEHGALRAAEGAIYRVGVSAAEARGVLDAQLANLLELARFVVAHAHAVVCEDERAVTNRALVESIDLQDFRFDPEEMRARHAAHRHCARPYEWPFAPTALARFRAAGRPEGGGRGTGGCAARPREPSVPEEDGGAVVSGGRGCAP